MGIMLAEVSAPVEIASWLGCAAFLVMLVNGVFKLKRNATGEVREIGPQPLTVKKADEFVTVQQCSLAHSGIVERLDGHDAQIQELWSAMREEDEETRKRMDESFQSIQRALGRIEGKLDAKVRE
jgi:hypothetical protein